MLTKTEHRKQQHWQSPTGKEMKLSRHVHKQTGEVKQTLVNLRKPGLRGKQTINNRL